MEIALRLRYVTAKGLEATVDRNDPGCPLPGPGRSELLVAALAPASLAGALCVIDTTIVQQEELAFSLHSPTIHKSLKCKLSGATR